MKLKNVFVQGKLNKDVDERLLPKGEYPHAENIRVANSDGSDAGAIENIKGNELLTNISLTNAKTLGALADTSNEKIYWFVTSEGKDLVLEYNFQNRDLSILLEDTRGILGFDENFLITGVVKVYNEDFKRDLLIWTDNLNPPRSVNIERAKTYGLDGFTEEQITLAKLPPLNSPSYQFTFDSRSSINAFADKFLAFAYRYKYKDGELSSLSPFSYYSFSPSGLNIDYLTLENRGMVNAFNALDISFETGSSEVSEIELVFKESGSNVVYSVESFSKNNLFLGDNSTFTYRFINDKGYTALPEDELFRLFDNVPNRAKALDIVGSRLVFGNYEEGFDIKDITGENIEIDYSVDIVSEEVIGFNLPVVVNSPTEINIDFTNLSLKEGVNIRFNIELDEVDDQGDIITTSNYSDSPIFILNKDYTDLDELFTDDDFIRFIEVTLGEVFSLNSVTTPPNNNVAPTIFNPYSFTILGNSLNITAPSITYTIDDGGVISTLTRLWDYDNLTSVDTLSSGGTASIKSNRSYELGIIYVDKYGKTSTVLTSLTNTIDVKQSLADKKNKFRVIIINNAPVDAVAYRMAVKQNRGFYHNIFATTFFEEGEFIWVKLEGTDKNKVKEGDILYVKADSSGVLNSAVETTVLEVTQKDADFIEGNVTDDGSSQITEPQGTYFKIKPRGYTISYVEDSIAEKNFFNDTDSNGSQPQVDVQISGINGAFKVTQNSIIEISVVGNVEREDVNFRGNYEYVSTADYDNIADWYEREVGFGTLDLQGSRPQGAFTSRNGSGIIFRSNEASGGKRRTSSIEVFIRIRNANGLIIFETKPDLVPEGIFYEIPETFSIIGGNHQGNIQDQTSGNSAIIELDWFNTFSLGEGVESISYLDGFNQKNLGIDLRPNGVSLQGFSKVRRFTDLTYSEPYNENNNFNGLNEFNLSKANFKDDIDKNYGSIQKLHARDTDLIVFQEDKVHKVLFGKDLLVNADGTSNITSTEQVLGQHIAYTGEYGISKHPESFSFDSNKVYFTDVKRGSVMRLDNQGLFEISNYGMRRYFKDEFKGSLNKFKLGGFDPYNDQYVLSLSNNSNTQSRVIDCGEVLNLSNFSGTVINTLNLGVQQGEVFIDFTTNGVPITVDIEYDGQTFSSGLVSNQNPQTITFNKTQSTPSTAIVRISTVECDASIRLTNNCIDAPQISVSSIVLNDSADEGLERISRFKWISGNYSSNYRTYNSVFEEASGTTVLGREGRIDLFDTLDGEQGENFLPIEGSTIVMESINSVNNPVEFVDCYELRYLVSDTELDASDIDQILALSTAGVITDGVVINGDTVKTVSFPLATSRRYVYLIWDYIDKKPVVEDDYFSTQKGTSKTFDVRTNDSDPRGLPLSVTIVNQPINGSVVVNPNGSVTYTHNNSETTSDSFTYVLSNGECDSDEATVFMDIAVSCDESFSFSGNQGVFEFNLSFGTGTGTVGINYESFSIPDQFEIFYDGELVATTGGLVSGNGTLTFEKTERLPTSATVRVTATQGGTAWNMSGICPIND